MRIFTDFSQAFYPIWNILNKYISSSFILISLSIFPFRHKDRRPVLRPALGILLCGSAITLCEKVITGVAEAYFVPIPFSYFFISVLSVIWIGFFSLYLYRENVFILMQTALLLYNIFSSVRFFFRGCILWFFEDPPEAVLWVGSEIPTCLICAVVCVLILHFQKNVVCSLSPSESVFLFSAAIFDMIVMCWLPTLSNEEWLGTILFSIVLLFTTGLIYILIFKYSSERYVALEQEKMLQNTQDMQTCLNQICESEEHIKAIRHELKNHIFCIREMVQNKDEAGLFAYLDRLLEQSSILTDTVFSGNSMADALLNHKKAYAESLGIRTVFTVLVPAKIRIDDLSLCSVLGNLLNNAVESAAGIPGAFLNLDMRLVGEYLTIRVENSAPYDVLNKNPRLLTTKKDAANHGIGLKVVEQLTNRYDGMLDIRMKDPGTFSVSVMLKNAAL